MEPKTDAERLENLREVVDKLSERTKVLSSRVETLLDIIQELRAENTQLYHDLAIAGESAPRFTF